MAFKVIREDMLETGGGIASDIRASLGGRLAVNIISSPGSGKTSLIEGIAPLLRKDGIPFAVIIGDCFTSRDAGRIDRLSVPVVQINTGSACHIEAQLIRRALPEVERAAPELIIIENVGNLVCPAEFDIGEDVKVAMLSVAEGHDKPMKYPLLFHESGLAVINKTDLLGHTDFDLKKCEQEIRAVHPGIGIIRMSCRTGDGMPEFLGWIKGRIDDKKERAR